LQKSWAEVLAGEDFFHIPSGGDSSLCLDRDTICAQILSIDLIDPVEPLGPWPTWCWSHGQCSAGAMANRMLEHDQRGAGAMANGGVGAMANAALLSLHCKICIAKSTTWFS